MLVVTSTSSAGAASVTVTGTSTTLLVHPSSTTTYAVYVPALDVEVTTSTRCLAGKAYVAVRAVNGEDVPLAIRLVTPFGTKAFAAVQPGQSAYQSFATRAVAVDAGTVTVEAVRGSGAEEVTASIEAGYDALSCG